jgi:glycosyltransferase involved in cell wall biosynthesis
VVGAESDREYARSVRQQARALGIDDRVRFAGRLSDAALADRFRESHLLAVPSLFEGYGIVYLEAMGFGVPPLATTSGGASELITHGEDGLLVPPDDSDAVAEAIQSLQTDRATLREMGLAARRRYECHPGWDESMAEVRRFLERVARGDADRREAFA